MDFLHSWAVFFPSFLANRLIWVKTLNTTNLVASRHIKKEKALLPVDVLCSKTSLLSSLLMWRDRKNWCEKREGLAKGEEGEGSLLFFPTTAPFPRSRASYFLLTCCCDVPTITARSFWKKLCTFFCFVFWYFSPWSLVCFICRTDDWLHSLCWWDPVFNESHKAYTTKSRP